MTAPYRTGVIFPDHRVTGHRELADVLRDQIHNQRLLPGSRFPSETDLQAIYSLSRDTVRAAVKLLESEGLVVVRHGQPSRVRDIHPKQPIDLAGVDRIEVRMPSPDERYKLGLHGGVPVFEVYRSSGRVDLLPGNRWHIPGRTGDR